MIYLLALVYCLGMLGCLLSSKDCKRRAIRWASDKGTGLYPSKIKIDKVEFVFDDMKMNRFLDIAD